MKVLETERLRLRQFSTDDAAFILELVNEPAFLQYIGDKKVRSLEDARDYLLHDPIASYSRHGFGLYMTEIKDGSMPIGMCGLLKRSTLPDPDIGFAFLQRHWSRGYAAEAARAVLHYGQSHLHLKRVVAIADPGNRSSISLLEKIGMQFEKMVSLTSDGPQLVYYGISSGKAVDA